ncbi:MAG: NAD-dependent epimerase/dehydratase family protein [Bacteroidales bacterium]|nr:NAD-dependent epimerase/dehydratase family protein [Bacteroidales bacterium]
MKKILLLGGFGFIGTNILKYIDAFYINEFSVIVFDRSLTHPKGISFKCVKKVYEGDFADKSVLRLVFSQHKFDYVIHAVNTTVPSTSVNARFDVESNLLPTIDLMDLLVEFKTSNIIFLSSGGAIYGEMIDSIPHKETDFEYPKSSYGIVKLAIEKYLFQYKELFKIHPLVLRVSNPYGAYHYSMKQGIINLCLVSATKHKEFIVWGNGEARKDYIYIDDFCSILFRMIKLGITDGIYNVGSNEILSINYILSQVKHHFPTFSWSNTENRKNDILHFQLDTTKLINTIGEVKFTPFSEGLLKTIKWLRTQEF